jgi:GNAT superfamily N-acetyltransferase
MSGEHVQVYQAQVCDARRVSELVHRLLDELGGFHSFDVVEAASLCEVLLSTAAYAAFLARDDSGKSLGVITLYECPALYVAGRLGWIQELYIIPQARSLAIGHQLIEAAARYGQARGWRRLEVNTPDAQAWPRTVAFYRREGFEGGAYHLRKTT